MLTSFVVRSRASENAAATRNGVALPREVLTQERFHPDGVRQGEAAPRDAPTQREIVSPCRVYRQLWRDVMPTAFGERNCAP
jgi:hypothetical protein